MFHCLLLFFEKFFSDIVTEIKPSLETVGLFIEIDSPENNDGTDFGTQYEYFLSNSDPTPLDIILNQFLVELDLPYTVLLNKIDKLKQSEIAKRKKEITQFFPELSLGDNLILYSALKGIGKKEVSTRLRKLFY